MRLRQIGLLLLPWCLLVLGWHVIASSGWVNEALMPTPSHVASKFIELLIGGRLGMDILKSTQRVVLGVSLGIALAVPLGFLIGWYKDRADLS